MENAAKALEIAAGVILAVILMSLIAYFFSTISAWPQQQDDLESAEQLAEFNLEYEVYDKSTMYGVDVISCLNKARSNNEKYVEGEGFLTGSKYDRNYIMNVYVKINTYLEEIIEIYYFDDEQKEVQRFADGNFPNGSKKLEELKSVLPEIGDSNYYTDLKEDEPLWTLEKDLDDATKYMVPNGGTKKRTLEDGTEQTYYALFDADGKTDKNSSLYKLIEFSSSNPKITVKNGNSGTLRSWSTAVWSTALYSFKTKRFKCDYIGYSSTTGRVNEIYFSEV